MHLFSSFLSFLSPFHLIISAAEVTYIMPVLVQRPFAESAPSTVHHS